MLVVYTFMEKERFEETKRELFGNDNLLIGKNDQLIIKNIGKWLSKPEEVNNPLNTFSGSTLLVKLFRVEGDNIVSPINDEPLTIAEVLNMYKKTYNNEVEKTVKKEGKLF